MIRSFCRNQLIPSVATHLNSKVGYRWPLVTTLGYQRQLPVTTLYYDRLQVTNLGYQTGYHLLQKFKIFIGNWVT